MTKKLILSSMALSFLLSCSRNDNEMEGVSLKTENSSLKLNQKQARAYASIFSSYMEGKGSPNENNGKSLLSKKVKAEPEFDYLIEKGDTLMYALNYKNNGGFILMSGANGAFPIIAHSDEGNIDFDKISKDNPLSRMINNYKEEAKSIIENPTQENLKYNEDWKDIGKEGYEYGIELNNTPPASKYVAYGRRSSTGKASIFPYTGKDLDVWNQLGDYNYYAPNRAAIGCPSVAIGMLMYDTYNRVNGESRSTNPSFDIYDTSIANAKDVSRKFKYIADNIPNYQWGGGQDKESGAYPNDITTGLRKLGYTRAELVPFNIDLLYNNMKYKGIGYGGMEVQFVRGVLLGGFDYRGGHIWFCDGYYEASYTVTKKFLGIRVKRWTEYEDKLYMNWGWGVNKGNGWFTPGHHGFSSHLMMYINLNHYERPNSEEFEILGKNSNKK